MSEPDDQIQALARALLEGSPVDWTAATSKATDTETRALIAELRTIGEVLALHGAATAEGESFSDVAPSGSGRRRWGAFELIELLGEGASGEVYRAWDTRLHREVALKLLHPSERPAHAADYVREGQLLARIRHPNVVAVHGADQIDGRVGIWMELIEGRTLESRLRDEGALPIDEAVALVVEVCGALGAVHQAGLLHGDVKAQNVVQTGDGRVVLMDFGAGRDVRDLRPTLSGTPICLAPELLNGEPPTQASDIYGVGVLLFRLIAGAYPIEASTIAELRQAHGRDDSQQWPALRARAPRALVGVVQRALARQPDARFASAEALGTALRELHRPTRRFRLVIAAGVSIALIGLAVWLTVWKDRGESAPGGAAALLQRRVALPNPQYLGKVAPRGDRMTFIDSSGELAHFDIGREATTEITKATGARSAGEVILSASPISHDGTQIAFACRTRAGVTELRVVDKNGGTPRVLISRAGVRVFDPVEWQRGDAAVLTLVNLQDGGVELALVSVSDGHSRTLPLPPGARPGGATLSPDGRFVAYDRMIGDTRQRNVFVIEVATGAEFPLVTGPGSQPMWSADGRRVYFTSDRTGSLGLWYVDVTDVRAPARPQAVHTEIGRSYPLSLTDAGRFYYMHQGGLVDVYTAALDPAARGPVKPAPVPTRYVGVNNTSTWAPDGRLAFVSTRSQREGLFSRTIVVRDASGDGERTLMPALGLFLLPRWNANGTLMLTRGDNGRGRDGVFIIDASTGDVRPALIFETPGDDARYGNFVWSPVHASHIVFDEIGAGLFALDVSTGNRERIVSFDEKGVRPYNGFDGFKLSSDGAQIAFYGPDPQTTPRQWVLKAGPLAGPWQELVRLSPGQGFLSIAWSADGSAVLYTMRPGPKQPPAELWRVPSAGGPPSPLGLSMTGLRNLEVSRYGLTFTAGWPQWDLWVMEPLR